ncbi:MAG TPA: hypothetical protein VFB59_01610 [Candidatus Saccharimonadales bacterium]|nr:hypothetical protein [Candidatus Saccharimonadales bacterium]
MQTPRYEELPTWNAENRRTFATALIQDMATTTNGDPNQWLYGLSRFLLQDDEFALPQEPLSGEVMPVIAGSLLESVPRTGGYLRAIQRAAQANSAIDAGCGPSAVLALGIAVFHPRAEIFAYELSQPSARCAAGIVDLLGFNDRITVIADNVLTTPLPNVDLGVTETFNHGLATEPGVKIAHRLSSVSGVILPAKAVMYAQVGPYDRAPWHKVDVIDFAEGREIVRGELPSNFRGEQSVSVRAEYLDTNNGVVIDCDSIASPLAIGTVDVPRVGGTVGFEYPVGHSATLTVARLWAAD